MKHKIHTRLKQETQEIKQRQKLSAILGDEETPLQKEALSIEPAQ